MQKDIDECPSEENYLSGENGGGSFIMNKCVIKRIIKIIIVLFGVIVAGLICFLMLSMFFLLRIDDHFKYKHSVLSKEEMFQMVIDEQEELELLVQEMKVQLDCSDAFIVSYDEAEYAENKLQSNLFDEYPITEVTAKRRNGEFKLTVNCAFCPNPYTYWGVYYTENEEASSWGGELEEGEEMLTEIGSYYKYETENIVGNWYYWQCMTR